MKPAVESLYMYLILFSFQSTGIHHNLRTFRWYRLPADQRNIYKILLHHTQQPRVIRIAKVYELNMETCVKVITQHRKLSLNWPIILFTFILDHKRNLHVRHDSAFHRVNAIIIDLQVVIVITSPQYDVKGHIVIFSADMLLCRYIICG